MDQRPRDLPPKSDLDRLPRSDDTSWSVLPILLVVALLAVGAWLLFADSGTSPTTTTSEMAPSSAPSPRPSPPPATTPTTPPADTAPAPRYGACSRHDACARRRGPEQSEALSLRHTAIFAFGPACGAFFSLQAGRP